MKASVPGLLSSAFSNLGANGDDEEEPTLELRDLPFSGSVRIGKKGL